MKNIIITESQFDRLLSKFDWLSEQQNLNTKSQQPINSKFKLNDLNNPINTGKIQIANQRNIINSVYKIINDNSKDLNLPKNELNKLYLSAKNTNDTKTFLNDVGHTFEKLGFTPHLSISKGDSGLGIDEVGLEFTIPNLRGSTASFDVGSGKVMAGVKLNI